MASNLLVALRLRGALLQVHALEHGILAEASSGSQYCLLTPMLLGEFLLPDGVGMLILAVIGEEFELLFLRDILRALLFTPDVTCRDVKATGEQMRVDDRVEELEGGIDDET